MTGCNPTVCIHTHTYLPLAEKVAEGLETAIGSAGPSVHTYLPLAEKVAEGLETAIGSAGPSVVGGPKNIFDQ